METWAFCRACSSWFLINEASVTDVAAGLCRSCGGRPAAFELRGGDGPGVRLEIDGDGPDLVIDLDGDTAEPVA